MPGPGPGRRGKAQRPGSTPHGSTIPASLPASHGRLPPGTALAAECEPDYARFMRSLVSPAPRAAVLRILAAALLLAAALPFALADEEALQWRWSGVRELVAIGDVHGAYEGLVSVLMAADLVDRDLSWSGDSAHLVMLGDLVDRGPRSRDVLDLVRRLQEEARRAGGRVHVVLGNHEAMVLTGDLRYLHPNDIRDFASEEREVLREAAFLRVLDSKVVSAEERRRVRQRFDATYPPGFFAHRAAFSPDGEYGKWLLDQHVLVVVNGMAFVHAGLPLSLISMPREGINEVVLSELREFLEIQQRLYAAGVLAPEMTPREQYEALGKRLSEKGAKALSTAEIARIRADMRRMRELFAGAVFDPEGPLWYRGTSLSPGATESRILARVLRWIDADAVVVGHTPSHTGRIETRMDGRVIRVDTGMLTTYYNGQPSALVLRGGRLAALYPGEGLRSLPGAAADDAPALFTASATLEEFLEEADVVFSEDVGAGITGAERLTLTRSGERHRAIFKTVDTFVRRRKAPTGPAKPAFTDRYANEIAAYRLDQLLGLNLVPPTVLRKVDGERGSLQLWIEDAISEANRRIEDLRPRDPAAYDRAMRRMNVFDALIQNVDRDPSNILITMRDGRVHLIDHSRAFGSSLSRPARLADERLLVDDELAASLEGLDSKTLRRALGKLLEKDRIDAILARRDAILEQAIRLETTP